MFLILWNHQKCVSLFPNLEADRIQQFTSKLEATLDIYVHKL